MTEYPLAAMLYNSNKIKFMRHNLIQYAAAIILIATYMLGIHGHETFGFSIIAIMTAILLLDARVTSTSQNLIVKIVSYLLRFLGRMSYELYLFHIIVLGVIRQFLPAASLSKGQTTFLAFAFFGFSVFAAWLCSRYYSEPLNNKIRKIAVNIGAEKIYDNV